MTRTMLTTVLAVAATVVVTIAVGGPAQALLGPSTPDTQHPEVGVMLPAAGVGKICGVTLVAPRVAVLAGHCVYLRRALTGSSRGTVTFDADITDGVQGPTYSGDLLLDPEYKPNGSGDHDLGAIVLDGPVEGMAPAALPDAGWLTELKDDGTLPTARFTLVGYGASQRGPGNAFTGTGRRLSSDNGYQALTDQLLKVRAAGDEAASCDQDSGGAVFIGSRLVGVIVLGDASCTSWTGATRLDAPVESAWVRAVVAAAAS